MLLIADRLRNLSFGSLMEVYRESNEWNGEEFFPMETPERQLALAEERFYQYLQEDFFSQPDARYFIWTENAEYVSALRLWSFPDGQLQPEFLGASRGGGVGLRHARPPVL